MHKVSLPLYPDEFTALVGWIPTPCQYSLREASTETVNRLLLIDWRGRISPPTALTWQMRANHKRYRVNMPLVVAKALHDELNQAAVGYELRNVLASLDRALTNLSPHTKTVFLQ